MSTLYFRNPTCLDVEMLLCESRKLLRARPKSYFDPQVEWSVVWRNKYKSDYNLSTMLVRVPLVHSSTNGGLSLSVVNLSAARKEGGSVRVRLHEKGVFTLGCTHGTWNQSS